MIRIIDNHLGKPGAKPSDGFIDDLGADSLDLVELVMAVEEEFDINVEEEELEGIEVVGLAGQAGQANYAASKAGLVGLARSLAREYATRGVTVNVVAPGAIATDMLEALTVAQRDAMVALTPVGRLGSPAEIASVIQFLASDDASYVTGVVLPVDGGMAMGA